MSESPPASDERRRGRRPRLLAGTVVAVVLLAVALAAWLVRDDDPIAEPGPSASPTAEVALSELVIDRGEFCDRLAVEEVEEALAAPVAGTNHYRSGERTALAPGITDVAHEYGCRYIAADGARARVWVFAEPVTGRSARVLARDTPDDGCRRLEDGLGYGAPSTGTTCPGPGRTGREVTRSGLFGDAWLSCQLTTVGGEPAAEAVRRSSQWCARVATSIGTRR
jgi:hypothetical protein